MVFPKEEKYKLQCEWGQCRAVYEYMNDFYVHLDEHFWKDIAPVPREETDSTLICQWCECNFVTTNDHDLIRHLYFHGFHTKLKWLGYLKHQEAKSGECQIHQNRNIIPELPDGFKCCWEQCFIIVDIPDKYYDHVRDHAAISDPEELPNGKRGFKCHWEGCEYVYALGSKAASLGRHKLRGHLITHTQERCYACPWCGNLYVNKTKLIDHFTRQISVENHSFQCTHCSRTFASERILKDHMRHHVNHYQCPKCAMTSPNPSALKHHIRYKHSNERPYACEFCDYRSKEPHDLQTHMQFHQSDLSYHCQVADCDYAVRSVQNLRYHYRVKHGSGNGKYYACHLCDKTHGTGYQLTHHLRKKHNFQWPPGHCRFRYKECEDGMFRLQIFRYESIELTKQIKLDETLAAELEKDANNEASTSAVITPSTSSPSKPAKPMLPRMNIQRQKKGAAKASGPNLRKLRQGRRAPGVATRRSNRRFKNTPVKNATAVKNVKIVTPNSKKEQSQEKKTQMPDLYMESEELGLHEMEHVKEKTPAKIRYSKKTSDKRNREEGDLQAWLSTKNDNVDKKTRSQGTPSKRSSSADNSEVVGVATRSSSAKKSKPSKNRFVNVKKKLQLTLPKKTGSSPEKQHALELDLIKECSVEITPLQSPVFPNHHELYFNLDANIFNSLSDEPYPQQHQNASVGTSGALLHSETDLMELDPSPTSNLVIETPGKENLNAQTSIAALRSEEKSFSESVLEDISASVPNLVVEAALPQTEDDEVTTPAQKSQAKLLEVNSGEIVTDEDGNRSVVNVGGEEFYLVCGSDRESGSSVYCLVKVSELGENNEV